MTMPIKPQYATICKLILFSTAALLLTVALTACGKDNKVSSQDEQIRSLIAALNVARTEAETQAGLIEALNSALAGLLITLESLGATSDAMQLQLDALQLQLVALEASQEQAEDNITSILIDLAVLQGYTHVAEILNPCGDAPGIVDEVLLKLSTGEILASFSANQSGLNTRFSIIGNGTYSVTDGSVCTFTILNGNLL